MIPILTLILRAKEPTMRHDKSILFLPLKLQINTNKLSPVMQNYVDFIDKENKFI